MVVERAGCGSADSGGVLVEASPALDAEVALVDVVAQQPSRLLGDPRADGGVVLLDVEDDVEADAVHQLKRWDAAADEDVPHRVDVGRRGDSFLDDQQTLALDRRPDAVEDEPVALAPDMEGRQPVVRELADQRFDDAPSVSPQDISSTAFMAGGM